MDTIHLVRSFDLSEKIDIYNEIVYQLQRDMGVLEKEIAPIPVRDFWYALDRRTKEQREQLPLTEDTKFRLSTQMAMDLLSKYEPNMAHNKQRIKDLQIFGNVWFDLMAFGVINGMI